MTAAATLFVFAVLVAAVFADIEFPCPQQQRPAGKTDCSYYCEMGGEWKLGKYQSGIECDYNAQNDGICKDGLCYGKDSVSSGSQPGPGNDEDNDFEDN